MKSCLVCGKQHENKLIGDILELYLQSASRNLFIHVRKRVALNELDSPICDPCGESYRKFLDQKMPALAAEFIAYQLMSTAVDHEHSLLTKKGLERAKASGIKLGRKKEYSVEQADTVLAYRKIGITYREIQRKTGLSQGTIWSIMKRNEHLV